MGNRLTAVREKLATFQKRHPLFCAAVLAVGGVGFSSLALTWAIIWTACSWVAGAWIGRWKLGLSWGVCVALASGVFLARTACRDRQEKALLESGVLAAQARVVTDPRGDQNYWSAVVVVDSSPYEGVRLWWQGKGELPVKGSSLQARGNLEPLPQARNPGEFDRAEWMRRQGVAAVFNALKTSTQIHTSAFSQWCATLRNDFRLAVTDGLEADPEAAKVVKAVVIGEISPDSDDLITAYRDSGTLHVFSVSGLHVAMAASIVWFVLRWCGVRRRQALVALIAVVFAYAWITGNSPPALRSAWMTAVFLTAFVLRRKGDLLNALGAVLLVATLWDGRLIFQPGVQLSYGVVAAIAVGVKFTERLFNPLAQPELYLPLGLMSRWQAFRLHLRRQIAQYLSASTAAWAGSTPLTIWHFGVVTPVSIFAGVPILPAVFLMLIIGLFSASLHPLVPRLSRLLNLGNGQMADLTTWMARQFSAIPGGHFAVGKGSDPFVLVYDLKYGAGAACFSSGNGSGLLLDAGDASSFKSRIVPSLRALGVTPDSLAITHPDGGHIGGGEKIWETFPIKQAVMPVAKARSPGYQMFLKMAPSAGVKLISGEKGQLLPLADDAHLETLYTPDAPGNASADERVQIYRLHWRGWKILFTSDAGTDIEQRMLAAHGDLSADVIVCGRPAHDENLSANFLDSVSPRVIVASNASFPASERLSPKQVSYWKSRGIQVMDQQQTGGVTLRVEKSGDLTLGGFIDGSAITLRRH